MEGENPNIGRMRATAIQGLQRWMGDLATLQQTRVSSQQAITHIQTIHNIERWRKNQIGIWTSLYNLFTQSGRQPIANEMLGRVGALIQVDGEGNIIGGHFPDAHRAYNIIRSKTPQEITQQWVQLKPSFDLFYNSMDKILELCGQFLAVSTNGYDDLELIGNIFDAEEAFETPMAIAISNMFMIEEQRQSALNLRKWSLDLTKYADYFEIPLNIRLNTLNRLSTLDLSDDNNIKTVRQILTGLITNGRVGNQPAHFSWDPQLVARGTCYDLVDTLRAQCTQRFASNSQHADPRRMKCVAEVLGQNLNEVEGNNHVERSEVWVEAEKAAQSGSVFPGFSPKATFDQHRSVITYLHYWTCDGRGTVTRLPIMQRYFASITTEVNNGLDQGRTRMERFKKYLIRSLGTLTTIHPHSIWLVDTMWKNLDAVFPGCIQTDRNFGEAQPGLDEAKEAYTEFVVGGRKRRKRKKSRRKRKKTRRKRKKTRRKRKKTKSRRKKRRKTRKKN